MIAKSSRKTGRKSSGKRAGRKSSRKAVPRRNALKKMAPVGVKLRSPSAQPLRRVAREGSYEVERNFGMGPLDIFHDLYASNSLKHHVWTNSLVIRAGTQMDRKPTPNLKVLGLQDLLRLDQSCLDDPEKHFYLDKVENMGHGLFALHAIPAS